MAITDGQVAGFCTIATPRHARFYGLTGTLRTNTGQWRGISKGGDNISATYGGKDDVSCFVGSNCTWPARTRTRGPGDVTGKGWVFAYHYHMQAPPGIGLAVPFHSCTMSIRLKPGIAPGFTKQNKKHLHLILVLHTAAERPKIGHL